MQSPVNPDWLIQIQARQPYARERTLNDSKSTVEDEKKCIRFSFSNVDLESLSVLSDLEKKNSPGTQGMSALASRQYGPGSILRFGVIYGLSLLVLYSAREYSPKYSGFFPSPQKQTFDLR